MIHLSAHEKRHPPLVKMIQIACTSVLLAILAGCASLTTGQNQSVSVETPGESGATCTLANDKGTWYVSSTPGSVTVSRAYSDMAVNCTKGTKKGNASVKSNTKGMAFGNILAGGVIGGAIDCGTGAAYDYPTMITVPLA